MKPKRIKAVKWHVGSDIFLAIRQSDIRALAEQMALDFMVINDLPGPSMLHCLKRAGMTQSRQKSRQSVGIGGAK